MHRNNPTMHRNKYKDSLRSEISSPKFSGARCGRILHSPLSVSHHRPCGLLFVLLLSAVLVVAPAGTADAQSQPQESVVAIADVHNAFDDFVAILQHTGLVDKQNHWAAGKTTFVQVGDLLDRGPKPREVMDLMMALEKEAPQAGGHVIGLLGNHEMMNIMGDLRYVIHMNYASFADGQSEARQKAAYEEYVKWRSGHAALLQELPQPMELTEAEWMARHPAGFVEQREALGPKGQYGAWLRGHDVVVELGGVIFLHGGIHPDLANMKLDAMNKRVHDEIKNFDGLKQYLQDEHLILPFFTLQEIVNVLQAEAIAEVKSRVPASDERQAKVREFLKFQEWLSVRVDGPLWFRGYDTWSDEEGAPQMSKVLQAYKATHVVVGHTVQKGGRIRPRFGNEVFLIDTGMLSSYYHGGRASALEICSDGKFVAVYLDQQVTLLDSVGGHGQGEGGLPNVASAGRVCSATAAPQ